MLRTLTLAPQPHVVESCGTMYYTNTSYAPNSTLCVPAAPILGVCVTDPLVLPSSIVALVEGLVVFCLLRRRGLTNSVTFSMAFFLYAIMMTLGGINHSLLVALKVPDSLAYFVGLSVGGLTSSIAFVLMLAALVDIGLLADAGLVAGGLSAVAPAAFIWMYYYFANSDAWWYLYYRLLQVCCGTFVVVEGVRLFSSASVAAAAWLAVGAVAGAAGLWAAFFEWAALCALPGQLVLLSSEAVWYAASNVAMFCVYRYWVCTHPAAEQPQGAKSRVKWANDDEAREGLLQ